MSATVTATQPPNQQEITDAIEHQIATGKSGGTTGDNLASELRSVIRDMAEPLTNPAFLALAREDWIDPAEHDDGDLWYDLRTSEALRLTALYQAAIEQAAVDCEATIVAALTAAGVQFAAEYPDAPRP